MKVPPAAATAWTSRRLSTVPAPIIARSPKASLAAEMLASASGELSGTSIIVMPAAISASQTATTSGVRDAAEDGDEVAVLGHAAAFRAALRPASVASAASIGSAPMPRRLKAAV